MKKNISGKLYYIALSLVLLAGCSHTEGNVGNLSTFKAPATEAKWITNGEPIEFLNELWYPQDSVDVLQDTEVSLIGEYKGVQFFVEKIDVQPYNRLYTKFGHNKFRIFERIPWHDKNKRPF